MIRKHVYSYYYIPAVKGDISRCAAQALTGMIPTEENAQVESEFSTKGREKKIYWNNTDSKYMQDKNIK